MSSTSEHEWGDTPTSFELSGSNNGTTWVTLDTRAAEVGWRNTETRFYEFVNDIAFEYYRIWIKGGGGSDSNGARFAEVGIHRKASDQTPFNLTASSAAGINGG